MENQSWFHGRLSRSESEALLKEAKIGSFLIRESDRKRNCFVLSFLGLQGINHFRINFYCGSYFIGGRRFSSLSQLIKCYQNSDLLKNERLVFAIHSKQLIEKKDEEQVVAILPYTKLPDSDELSFQKGEIFVIENRLKNGWFWCKKLSTNESGLVFSDLVQKIDQNIDHNEIYPWFHSKISKEEAVNKLAMAGPGSFLVRPSDNSPGNYSLFFHVLNTVQRFRIERRSNSYLMGGRVFNSLEEIISRYKEEQIVEGFYLKIPVNKNVFESRLSLKEAQQMRANDIYATLRESREKKNTEIFMKGFLLKKSNKNHKKWKNLYFILNSKESILYYYENPRRTKPKGLIDLSYTFLYLVHDSMFERSNCFQLVEKSLPCISTIYYLCCVDGNLNQWIASIKSFCHQNKLNDFQQIKSLHLTLIEANQLPIKLIPNPFIYVSLNGIKIGKSAIKCPPDPIWEEDFIMDDISHDIKELQLVLVNKGKKMKDVEIAEICIQLEKLAPNEEIESWFTFNGLCSINENWGSAHIRLYYANEIIMPLIEYKSLMDLLLNDSQLVIIKLCEEFCYRDRNPLANALLKIAKYEKKEIQLIKLMIENEINLENEESTLFRSNSLTTSLIDLYMKSICYNFVHKSLSSMISKVIESKQSCELNPSRLDSPQEACNNAQYLLHLLDEIIENIFKNCENCPKNLRIICSCLQENVVRKWPQNPLIRSRVVSSFIFLRLLCPAILNPKQFNLISEIPSETAARSLILIAKSIQNLANLIEFGTKSIFITADRFEPPPHPNSNREIWMEIVNPFILKNKGKMIKYLDEISKVSFSQEEEEEAVGVSDCSRELAFIHSICEIHKQEIVDKNQVALKKLAAVVEMLSAHKSRYTQSGST